MKAMHKLLAMVLALTLVLAMATTAFAEGEEGGTLEITGAESSTVTYDVYKVCDVEVVAPGEEATYKYSLANGWEGFVSIDEFDDYFTKNVTDGKIYLNWNSNNASATDGAAVAQLAKKYAEKNHLSPIDFAGNPLTVNGNPVHLDDNGYYLLVPSDGTTCGVIVVANEEVKITEKSTAPGLPTVNKTVQEDSTNTYGSSNDVDIGQKITFQTTITAGGSNSNFILHDRMDNEHMEWLGGGNITRDGNLLTPGVDAKNPGDYYVVKDIESCNEGCTFHVVFNESVTSRLHEGATLVVNYFAVLKPDAPCGVNHTNETWLTYTAENASTNRVTTTTNTYKVRVLKVDQDKQPLPGATFVLKDNVDKYYSWGTIDLGNGKSTEGVIWVSEIDEALHVPAEQTTLDGKTVYMAEFKGVDAENFTVVETVVPGGYTGAGEVSVSTKDNPEGGIATVTIKNVLGNALPETGGMGTTMFYVVGGLMAAAAVVLLITKKRVSAK